MTVLANPGSILFRLKDLLADLDDASVAADLSLLLAAWREKQPSITRRLAPSREELARNDSLLEPLRARAGTGVPLLMFLAFVDTNFFFLARRMAARTLARPGKISQFHRLLFARLMDSDPPHLREKTGRDVPLVIGLRLAVLSGHSAERNRAGRVTTREPRTPREQSACEMALERFREAGLHVQYDAIAKRWGMRERTLLTAGFSAPDVSEFLGHPFRTPPNMR